MKHCFKVFLKNNISENKINLANTKFDEIVSFRNKKKNLFEKNLLPYQQTPIRNRGIFFTRNKIFEKNSEGKLESINQLLEIEFIIKKIKEVISLIFLIFILLIFYYLIFQALVEKGNIMEICKNYLGKLSKLDHSFYEVKLNNLKCFTR